MTVARISKGGAHSQDHSASPVCMEQAPPIRRLAGGHGAVIGHLQYWRAKGLPWVDLFRPWVLPALGGAGVGRYLGLSTTLALILAVAIPLIVETCAVILGWLEHRSGAVEAHYRLAAETDPYRFESLARLQEIRDELARIHAIMSRQEEERYPKLTPLDLDPSSGQSARRAEFPVS